MLGFKNGLAVITALSVTFSVSFLTGNDKVMAGGFMHKCVDVSLTDRDNDPTSESYDLTAKCTNSRTGRRISSSIFLDPIIKNDNGSLAWGPPGGYNQECSYISLEEPFGDTYYLTAACPDRQKNSQAAVINLNEKIGVNDVGQLTYEP